MIRHPELEDTTPTDDKPGVREVLSQLVADTSDFARAEFAYLKAQADERASYAIPALVMIGIATALGAGAVVALVVGLMLVLSPLIGMPGAVALVTFGATLAAWILFRMGSARLRNTLKPRGER
jgi:hypothetical protein